MHVVARVLAAVMVASAVLMAAVGLAVVSTGTLRQGFSVRLAADDLALSPLAARSVILAADGTVLSALYEEDRVPVPLTEVPKVLIDAVVAVEDAAFFQHDGLSLRGALRALRTNAKTGEVAQGGSTITQQLVKNRVLTAERTLDRKLREAVLAVRMEEELSKEEILERYLNTVYFGQGAYGVRSAAERFFAKDLVELDLAEAALLAGMIANPEGYDPLNHPDEARARRAHALDRMVTTGAVTPEEAEAAGDAPLPTSVTRMDPQPDDYFGEEVRRQLLADERLGDTPQQRFNAVFRGGLRVHTTLEPTLQEAAERAVRETLPESPFTAALVAIDPANGAVSALVGGKSFEETKFNLATQGARQVGSAFKTIALAAWLEAGHSPEDMVEATAPCEFPMPPPEPPWRVDNYEGGSGETLVTTLREATVRSSNCAYARLSLALGPQRLADMAGRLGISRPLPPVASIVLGTAEVSPVEMASVAATLAAEGIRRRPTFIRKVEDANGRVVMENASADERVLDAEIARTVTDVLRGVIDRGTGRRAAIGRPVAGKTGTAQEWRDAWFMGYARDLAAAVWMGHPDGQHSMVGVGGINVTGGSYPAGVWASFMRDALAERPPLDFVAPDATRWPPPGWVGEPPPPPPPAPTSDDHTQAVPAPSPTGPPSKVDKPGRGRGGGKDKNR